MGTEGDAVRQAAIAHFSAHPQSEQPDHDLREFRKKIVHGISSDLLDFKHCSSSALEACVELLLRLCRNVASSPEERKYRQVKASSQKLSTTLAVNPGAAQKLLFEAGWLVKVVDFEKHYVYEAGPGSLQFRHLQVLVEELQSAHKLLKEKEQRGFANKGKQKQEAEERRKLALLQFQDDRDRRRLLDEQHQASLAQETASPRSPRSATNLHGQEPPLSPQTKKDQ